MSTDPGLQPERTTLAWTRTGISASVLAALLVRGAVKSGSGIAAAAAVAGILGALAILGTGSHAFGPVRRMSGSQSPRDHQGIRAVTGIVLVVGLLTAGTIIVG